jgi:NhaP-type Na+/H+ or K+/H+ antiporter
VVGAFVGYLGGRLLVIADTRGWSLPFQEPIGTLAIALICYSLSVAAGGNGFVAAFAGGVAFGGAIREHKPPKVMDFAERTGFLLSFTVWFIFGADFIRPALTALTWQVVVYALLSLTIVRMLPVMEWPWRCALARCFKIWSSFNSIPQHCICRRARRSCCRKRCEARVRSYAIIKGCRSCSNTTPWVR